MADDIERTIFKLELDGSAYIEGADKLTASTNKLSQAQEAANKKLTELKSQQNSFKEVINSTTESIKLNEKEIDALTKKLQSMTVNTRDGAKAAKELRQDIEKIRQGNIQYHSQLTALKTNLANTTTAIKVQSAELKTNLAKTTTAIKVQSAELKVAEKATGGFASGLTKAYSGLRNIANIIPGLGISSLVLLVAGPLVKAFQSYYDKLKDVNDLNEKYKQSLQDIDDAAKGSITSESAHFQVLLAIARDNNIALGERKNAVAELQKLYPSYLGNLSQEQILTGNITKEVNELTTALLNKGLAQTAEKKFELSSNQFYELTQKRTEATEKLRTAQIKYNKAVADNSTEIRETYKETFEARIRLEEFNRLFFQADLDRNKYLADTKKFGVLAGGLYIPPPPPPPPPPPKAAAKDDFKKRQADLLKQLRNLATAELEEEIKIRKEYADKLADAIKSIEDDKTLVENKKVHERTELIKLAEKVNEAELEKALKDFNDKKAKIISDAFIKEFDAQDAEDKKLLQQQLDAGAASIKAIEDAEKAKYAAMKTPVPKGQGAVKTPKPTDDLAAYAEAVGKVADSVIQFWDAANAAESKALDYSIALQEKRVDAAQKIADRGNAQYLKAEQDRLTELNVQRENAARKQLGIDAALQASQILVGITGAIADLAKGPGGPAKTIADIAIIIGALATGYGLVKSLQGNVPKLKGGTKYLTGDGYPSGIDTIPAHLNKGEAVIPTDKNKAYQPAVAAIYDGTIPAEHLNAFVKNYHHIKPVPQLNYEGIGAAAALHIGHDGRMSVLLEENNELQRQTLRAMKSMSVSANIDRNGVAIIVNEYVEKMRIDKRL